MTPRVVIAGAGPAGVATAARLAQHGRASQVIVLERYAFPRDKPCGGALTGHCDHIMADLDLVLDVPFASAPRARVRFADFERSVTLGKPVNVVRRTDFDASLVAQVSARGVEVRENEGVVGFALVGSRIDVHTSLGRTLACDVLVGADGAASIVRKQLQGKHKQVPHRLFRIEMAADGCARAGSLLYDFSLMSAGLRGYSWVFPGPDGLVNVGLMHYPSTGNRLGGAALTELLRRGLLRDGIALPSRGVRGWPVWGYDPKATVAAARVLTVGDAAGIDGLTGEGIAVAMEQAAIAGDEIDRAFRDGDFSFAGYAGTVRRAVVGRELALDRHLASLLYDSERWRDWLSLVLFDRDMLKLYATRVDGSEVLADQRWRLVQGLVRHGLSRRRRLRRLRALEAHSAGCA